MFIIDTGILPEGDWRLLDIKYGIFYLGIVKGELNEYIIWCDSRIFIDVSS